MTHHEAAKTIAEVRPEDLRIPEDRKSTLSWDAHSDFVLRTLSAVKTVAGKLAYCSSLKQAGSYRHWGLEQKHGHSGVQVGIGAAHRDVLRTWLGLRCMDLERDFSLYREFVGLTEGDALNLLKQNQAVRPANCDALENDNYSVQLLILSELIAAKSHLAA